VLDLPHVRAYLILKPNRSALEALGVGHQARGATCRTAGLGTGQDAWTGRDER
jgi:hypothetical protein